MGLAAPQAHDGLGTSVDCVCDICGKRLEGGAWEPAERTKAGSFTGTALVGLACRSCGYATCWSLMGQHLKDLKPHGFRRLRYGNCPTCTERMKDANVLAIWTVNEATDDQGTLLGEAGQAISDQREPPGPLERINTDPSAVVEVGRMAVESGDPSLKDAVFGALSSKEPRVRAVAIGVVVTDFPDDERLVTALSRMLADGGWVTLEDLNANIPGAAELFSAEVLSRFLNPLQVGKDPTQKPSTQVYHL
ncbi:MAG: hypothetical protein HKN93_06080, partial [Acidimicrobiia bacterium]|nr:hypothetical protein [Acidimicrobiia bacterium]